MHILSATRHIIYNTELIRFKQKQTKILWIIIVISNDFLIFLKMHDMVYINIAKAIQDYWRVVRVKCQSDAEEECVVIAAEPTPVTKPSHLYAARHELCLLCS